MRQQGLERRGRRATLRARGGATGVLTSRCSQELQGMLWVALAGAGPKGVDM